MRAPALIKPKLKDGHTIVEVLEGLEINYMGEEFLISSDIIEKEYLKKFLSLIDGKHSREEVYLALASAMDKEDVDDLITVLDQSWLLTEGKEKPLLGPTGLQFIIECEDFYRYLLNKKGATKLSVELASGKADLNLLYGFTLEYYHITTNAHPSISPTLAYQQERGCKEVLRQFYLEEQGHDELIMKSLLGVGFSREEVANSIPLPYTSAIMDLLTSFAVKDPLTFMTLLFIFEGKPWEEDLYVECLSLYDVPDEFIRHQKAHADINNQGEHGLVSREMLSQLDYISYSEKIRVFHNVQTLVETTYKMHDNIYNYYSNKKNPIPRPL